MVRHPRQITTRRSDKKEKERTLWNHKSTWTHDISIAITNNLEDPQCVPWGVALPIQRNRSIWGQLPITNTWANQWRGIIWNREHNETSKKREELSILREIERIPYLWSNVWTRRCIFRQWRPSGMIQTMPSTMNIPAVITLPLSLMENMWMELVWKFTDLFDQFQSIQEMLEGVKSTLKNNESITECNLPSTINNYQ